jgi:hypothetical protein
MSKNGKPKQPQVRAQIVITLYEDGNFQVNGPLHDRILFYGLLEMARDSVLMQAGRKVQERQAAEAVKGSAPWWRKIFSGKVAVPGAANDVARRADGKGGLEKNDPHSESAGVLAEVSKPH